MVGAITTGDFRRSAMALALSIVLPPPNPMTKLQPFSLAKLTTRLISLSEASPLKKTGTTVSPF